MSRRSILCMFGVAAVSFAPVASGQVFVYSLEGAAQGDGMGGAISRIGDVDQDGCDDFIVGAPHGHSGDGEARIFSGKSGAEIARIHGRAGSNFGFAVDGKIDADLDGFPDVLISAPADNAAGVNAGRVVVYSVQRDVILLDLPGGAAHDGFGYAVRSLQDDLDGDGVVDFIVGVPVRDRAYVYSGATGSVLFSKQGQADSEFGFSVSGGGRIDGDGFADFLVGSPYFVDATGTELGRVSAFSGKDGQKIWSVDGDLQGSIGWSIAHPGDLDGDAHGDVVFGAPAGTDPNGNVPGFVNVVSGATAALLYRVYGDGNFDNFGFSVRGVNGDVDGDGVSDFLVGAPQFLPSAVGYARFVSGANGASLFTYVPRTQSPDGLTEYGWAVAGGDLDGDGRPDAVIGGDAFDSGRGILEAWLTAGATSNSYGAGWAGSLGIPTLTAAGAPIVGQPLDVDLSNSLGATTPGYLAIGADPTSILTGKGGTLLVAALQFEPIAIPPSGLVLHGNVPNDPLLYGFHLYVQSLELDVGATQGVSFTAGLEIVFGFP